MKKLFAVVVFLLFMAAPGTSQSPLETSEFKFARVKFTQRQWTQYWDELNPGPPWWHDWPFSDEFVTGLLQELTRVRTNPEARKNVDLNDPEIFEYPFLYFSEPGFMALTPHEISNLGEYLRRGGFIMADDFRDQSWGQLVGDPDELELFRHYLTLAAPEFQLVRLDVSHPIFHQFFDIDTLDMKPPYGDFIPQFWGLVDEHGKLHGIANYNNDLGDFWEDLDKGEAPLRPAVRSTQLGINYVLYAMSH